MLATWWRSTQVDGYGIKNTVNCRLSAHPLISPPSYKPTYMQTKKYIWLLAHPDISPRYSFDFVLKLINWIRFIAAFLRLQL